MAKEADLIEYAYQCIPGKAERKQDVWFGFIRNQVHHCVVRVAEKTSTLEVFSFDTPVVDDKRQHGFIQSTSYPSYARTSSECSMTLVAPKDHLLNIYMIDMVLSNYDNLEYE